MADGTGCNCYAWYPGECCCEGVDWRSLQEVELEDACAELTDLCDRYSAALKLARVVLEDAHQNINPERGFADEIESDIVKALAAIDALGEAI